MNGTFWRAVLIPVISAAIIGLGTGLGVTLVTVIEIKATLAEMKPMVERRLTVLEGYHSGKRR